MNRNEGGMRMRVGVAGLLSVVWMFDEREKGK
jgi:hypothetical protein